MMIIPPIVGVPFFCCSPAARPRSRTGFADLSLDEVADQRFCREDHGDDQQHHDGQ